MRKIISLVLALYALSGTAQTYNSSSQGSNNGAGSHYVAPVVTKTYTMPEPKTTAPVSSFSATSATSQSSYKAGTTYANPMDAPIYKKIEDPASLSDEEFWKLYFENADATALRNGYRPDDKDMKALRRRNIEENSWPKKKPASYQYSEGTASVQRRFLFGVVDTTGNIIVPIVWEFAAGFYQGLCMVRSPKDEKKYGFLDRNNRLVIPLKYQAALTRFSEGLAGVELDDKWGFIDSTDTKKIAFDYDLVHEFKQGLAIVKKREKYGVIDKSGTVIIPIKQQEISYYTDDLFIYKYKDKWGAFDRKGVSVIEPIYDKRYWFDNGIARVTKNGRSFNIDKTGQEVK